MSLEYAFRKQDIPFEQWLGKIDEIVVPAEPGNVPDGAWRELLVSHMVRSIDEGDGGSYAAKFLTEGSIRGVLVSEEDDRVAIKLHSFASRGDQFLAARLAWEAMNLGATVEREDDGEIGPDDVNAEAVEAIHRNWFALSRASIKGKGEIHLPIYDFLAISLADGDKDDE
ncbi:MAG TPA: hypothetical protein VLO11_02950, partial [Luteolibacter sp.]|nr:hypothetical protein [Luteolibacter sp.]